jgi:transcriptional regulator with XRE-family HTH domain
VSTAKTNISNKFSDRVLALRKRLGMTQGQFADEMRINRSYLSEIENDRVTASAKIEERVEILEREAAVGKPTSVEGERLAASDPRSLLKKRREELKISLPEMAQRTRFKVAYIRDVEEGRSSANERFLRKAAKILDLDPDELMGGSDHPRVIDEHRQTFGAKPETHLTDKLTAKTIPLISMAQAGDLVEFEDVYDYEGVIAYAGKDPRAIAVRIRGESMSPDYAEGTIAILYPSFAPKNDNLVVAKTRDGNVLFKRLQIAAGEVIFHSINPNYKPMRYAERDIVWIYPVGLTQKVEL